ncbi:hypothetical protein ACFZAE_15105 [Streptomyces scabiei]|uniref:hypothetical protein n=1 Tax=Streptomyces scabiei TaxID=1930 RepID=UPI0036E21978
MSSWRESHSDNAFVRQLMWECLPEYRQAILDLEAKEALYADGSAEGGTPVDVNMHFVISDIFVGQVFDQLFGGGEDDRAGELDAGLARRCSTVVEELLGSGRPNVLNLVSLRVTDHLLGFVHPWLRFKPFAGPLLRQEIESRKQYYTGPF